MIPEAGVEELRLRFASLRDALPAPHRADAGAALRKRLEAFCVSRRIRRIAAFWPRGSEVDLRPLVASRSDWLWYFPRVASTDPPRLAWGTEPLQPGLWGRMEPFLTQHFTPPAELLLVPGLAFDDEGYRLDEGGNYYDALIARLEDQVTCLGCAFEAQRIPRLPREPLEQPVHGLLTEAGLTWFQEPGDRIR